MGNESVTKEGKKYEIGEKCPEKGCGGTIKHVSGGGFSNYLTVRCDKCGVSKTGYSIDVLF